MAVVLEVVWFFRQLSKRLLKLLNGSELKEIMIYCFYTGVQINLQIGLLDYNHSCDACRVVVLNANLGKGMLSLNQRNVNLNQRPF